MQNVRPFIGRKCAFLLLLCIAALVPMLQAHAEEAASSEFGLTGDWGGQRTTLAEKGISFSLDLTSQVQGVLNGGNDESTRVLGSSEFLLDLDTDKLGLWPGGFLRVAAEGRFGRGVGAAAGNLSPVSNDALFPFDEDRTGDEVVALTELFYTQFFSPQVGAFGGLLNTSGGDDNEYSGNSRSNEHFMNLSFLFSAVEGRAVPNVTLGGGLILIPHEKVLGTLTYLESEESAGTNPFHSGSGSTLATEWTFKHELAGLPGRQVIGGIYAWDNEFFRLGEDPRVNLAGVVRGQGLPETDDTWS
ncbi:MAG: porin, partial [Deltaproteobacteria bacterium]|nr:porin [Deltaproteobacteria bacterium]